MCGIIFELIIMTYDIIALYVEEDYFLHPVCFL